MVIMFNSSKRAMGVGIAIRRKISHNVNQVKRDEAEENYPEGAVAAPAA